MPPGVGFVLTVIGLVAACLVLMVLYKIALYQQRRAVNHYPYRAPNIMSCGDQNAVRTERTNERTNERSPHDLLWRTFLLDRTRTRLIAVMVDSDLTVSEIRSLLKGESAAIGQEVEAARLQQGKEPTQPYRTPIAGRVTDPRNYHQDDPDLVYQPPN